MPSVQANSLDPKAFRQALGTFTTGVTIITARDAQGRPVGMTANSFNSVSLEPPMVLWSLAKTSRNLATFESAEHWAVHILSVDQETLSNRFAKSGEDKFSGVDVEDGVGNLPLLPGCTTRLQCKASFKYEGGDHLIFVGEVLAFDRNPVAPLAFQSGAYAIATRKPPAPLPVSDSIVPTFEQDFLGYLLSRAHFDLYARVREIHQAQRLCDEEFFLLSSLLAHEHQTLHEVNRLFGLSGRQVMPEHVSTLVARGLVAIESATDGADERLRLADQGRDLALHMMAAIKAIESEVIAQLGSWEALSLKSLLKQLVAITDTGLHGPASS